MILTEIHAMHGWISATSSHESQDLLSSWGREIVQSGKVAVSLDHFLLSAWRRWHTLIQI